MVPEITWEMLTEDERQALQEGVLSECRCQRECTRPQSFVQDIRQALESQRKGGEGS